MAASEMAAVATWMMLSCVVGLVSVRVKHPCHPSVFGDLYLWEGREHSCAERGTAYGQNGGVLEREAKEDELDQCTAA